MRSKKLYINLEKLDTIVHIYFTYSQYNSHSAVNSFQFLYTVRKLPNSHYFSLTVNIAVAELNVGGVGTCVVTLI